MKYLIIGIIASTLSFSVFANTASPYAGQDTREIKALSHQAVEGYLNGKGLGYARAAELNHFPGPAHVLELAEALNLTEEQTRQTQVVFDTMKARAIVLGKQFVAKEQELDRQFSGGTINADSLRVLLSVIEALQADIRYVHLSAHLDQKALLTEQQVRLYDQLRGYGKSRSGGHDHAH